jgi:hypothetical protein
VAAACAAEAGEAVLEQPAAQVPVDLVEDVARERSSCVARFLEEILPVLVGQPPEQGLLGAMAFVAHGGLRALRLRRHGQGDHPERMARRGPSVMSATSGCRRRVQGWRPPGERYIVATRAPGLVSRWEHRALAWRTSGPRGLR